MHLYFRFYKTNEVGKTHPISAEADKCAMEKEKRKKRVTGVSQTHENNRNGSELNAKEAQTNNTKDTKVDFMNRFSNKVDTAPDLGNTGITSNASTNSGFQADVENGAGSENHEVPGADSTQTTITCHYNLRP